MREKKNLKRLSLLLVFAMVLTVLTPATNAEAAVSYKTYTNGYGKAGCTTNVTGLKQLLKSDSHVYAYVKNLTKERTYSIPEGDYSDLRLRVNAPKSVVWNSGTFKIVKISDLDGQMGWHEYAKGNSFSVVDTDVKMYVEKDAAVDRLYFKADEGKVNLSVRGDVRKTGFYGKNMDADISLSTGSVKELRVASEGGNIDVNARKESSVDTVKIVKDADIEIKADTDVKEIVLDSKADVTITGNAEKIEVTVTEKAEGAKVETSVPVEVNAGAKVELTLNDGAEGTTVTKADEKVEVAVDNNTSADVVIGTEGSDKTETVESGSDTATGGDTTTGGGTGGNGGGNPPVIPPVDPDPEEPVDPPVETNETKLAELKALLTSAETTVVWNKAVTLTDGTTLTVPEGKTLVLGDGAELTVQNGAVMELAGTVSSAAPETQMRTRAVEASDKKLSVENGGSMVLAETGTLQFNSFSELFAEASDGSGVQLNPKGYVRIGDLKYIGPDADCIFQTSTEEGEKASGFYTNGDGDPILVFNGKVSVTENQDLVNQIGCFVVVNGAGVLNLPSEDSVPKNGIMYTVYPSGTLKIGGEIITAPAEAVPEGEKTVLEPAGVAYGPEHELKVSWYKDTFVVWVNQMYNLNRPIPEWGLMPLNIGGVSETRLKLCFPYDASKPVVAKVDNWNSAVLGEWMPEEESYDEVFCPDSEYGIFWVVYDSVMRLQNRLDSGEINVVCEEPVTIASGASIFIPAGKTLSVAAGGSLEIQLNGTLYVKGTLETGASDLVITEGTGEEEPPIILMAGGTWKQGDVIYRNGDTNPEGYNAFYHNNGCWQIFLKLIIEAPESFELDLKQFIYIREDVEDPIGHITFKNTTTGETIEYIYNEAASQWEPSDTVTP